MTSRDMIDSPYGRDVEEWKGATPNSMPPPRVRTRVFDRKKGLCHKCGRKIRPGEKWTCEHLKAVINGGENRERDLDLTCCNCLPEKNAADVAEKSAVATKRKKHILPTEKRHKWARRPMSRPHYDNTKRLEET